LKRENARRDDVCLGTSCCGETLLDDDQYLMEVKIPGAVPLWLAVGLACGMGFIPYAAVFTAILCLVMVVLHYTNFTKPKASHIQLTVTVPENLNYQGLFDDVLDQYTDS